MRREDSLDHRTLTPQPVLTDIFFAFRAPLVWYACYYCSRLVFSYLGMENVADTSTGTVVCPAYVCERRVGRRRNASAGQRVRRQCKNRQRVRGALRLKTASSQRQEEDAFPIVFDAVQVRTFLDIRTMTVCHQPTKRFFFFFWYVDDAGLN